MRRATEFLDNTKLIAAGVISKNVLRLIMVGFSLLSAPFQAVAQTRSTSPLIPRFAPNFVLRDLNRHRIELRGYRGKVVLLNFWATWCGPCMIEMPQFGAWQEQFGREQFQVLGISMDDSEAPVQA